MGIFRGITFSAARYNVTTPRSTHMSLERDVEKIVPRGYAQFGRHLGAQLGGTNADLSKGSALSRLMQGTCVRKSDDITSNVLMSSLLKVKEVEARAKRVWPAWGNVKAIAKLKKLVRARRRR